MKQFKFKSKFNLALINFLLLLFCLKGNQASAQNNYKINLKLFYQGYYRGNGLMVPVEYCQCKANPNNCTSNIYPMDEVCSVDVDFFVSNSYVTQPSYSFLCKLKTDGNITCDINLASPFPVAAYYIGVRQKLNPNSPIESLSNSFSVLFPNPISISALTPAHTSIDCDFTLVPPPGLGSAIVTGYYTNTYDIDGCISANTWSFTGFTPSPPSQDGFYKIGTGEIASSITGDFGQDHLMDANDYASMENEVYCPGLPYQGGQPPGTGCIYGGVGQVADLDGSGGTDIFDFSIMLVGIHNIYFSGYPFIP